MRKFSNNLLPTENEKLFFLNDTAVKKNKNSQSVKTETQANVPEHILSVFSDIWFLFWVGALLLFLPWIASFHGNLNATIGTSAPLYSPEA